MHINEASESTTSRIPSLSCLRRDLMLLLKSGCLCEANQQRRSESDVQNETNIGREDGECERKTIHDLQDVDDQRGVVCTPRRRKPRRQHAPQPALKKPNTQINTQHNNKVTAVKPYAVRISGFVVRFITPSSINWSEADECDCIILRRDSMVISTSLPATTRQPNDLRSKRGLPHTRGHDEGLQLDEEVVRVHG